MALIVNPLDPEGQHAAAQKSVVAAAALYGEDWKKQRSLYNWKNTIQQVLAEQVGGMSLKTPVKKFGGYLTGVFAQQKKLLGGVGEQFAKNQEFAALMKKSKFKPIGTVKTPSGKKYGVSVSSRSMKYSGREMVTAKYSSEGRSILQPFYKSSGTGVPSLKSGGKWLPFEGILPKGSRVPYTRQTSMKTWKTEPLTMQPGWIIKGFKRGGKGWGGHIIGTGAKKAGLPMHSETGKLISSYQRSFGFNR